MTDVPVSQEAREAAADYQDHARGYACSAPLRDGRADHVCIVQAFAKFEQSIRQQAERDVIARMEVVGWMYTSAFGREVCKRRWASDEGMTSDHWIGWTETPLYALPTLPAGEA